MIRMQSLDTPTQLWQRRSGGSCATKRFKSEVTGKRVNREGAYCLKILARFRYYGPEKATQCLETGLTKMKEQLKESVNYY